jgi:glucokinase
LQQAVDPAAVISEHALDGKAPICERVLDIFVSIYGAEAGNLALKLMATGGVFLSGGIAAKILPKLTGPAFMQAFISKGRLQPMMETIPVKVIVNDRVGLIGAARYAALQKSTRG